mmetsp:Transcript_19754/g.59601  ORF Transcript_19754/g.59601 Transcript_19754/m.59601 type:complete len:411 (+) Transcript_19754:114-1346(+)
MFDMPEIVSSYVPPPVMGGPAQHPQSGSGLPPAGHAGGPYADWAEDNWKIEDEDMDEGVRIDRSTISKSVPVHPGMGARMRHPSSGPSSPSSADFMPAAQGASSSAFVPAPPPHPAQPYVAPMASPPQQLRPSYTPPPAAMTQPGCEQRPSYTPPPVGQHMPSQPSYTPAPGDPLAVTQDARRPPMEQRPPYMQLPQVLPGPMGALHMAHMAQQAPGMQPGAYQPGMPMQNMQMPGAGAISINTRPDQAQPLHPMGPRGHMPQPAMGSFGMMPQQLPHVQQPQQMHPMQQLQHAQHMQQMQQMQHLSQVQQMPTLHQLQQAQQMQAGHPPFQQMPGHYGAPGSLGPSLQAPVGSGNCVPMVPGATPWRGGPVQQPQGAGAWPSPASPPLASREVLKGEQTGPSPEIAAAG